MKMTVKDLIKELLMNYPMDAEVHFKTIPDNDYFALRELFIDDMSKDDEKNITILLN